MSQAEEEKDYFVLPSYSLMTGVSASLLSDEAKEQFKDKDIL
jgi:hypothetical protein